VALKLSSKLPPLPTPSFRPLFLLLPGASLFQVPGRAIKALFFSFQPIRLIFMSVPTQHAHFLKQEPG